jgi:hypothetical protein
VLGEIPEFPEQIKESLYEEEDEEDAAPMLIKTSEGAIKSNKQSILLVSEYDFLTSSQRLTSSRNLTLTVSVNRESEGTEPLK